MFSDVSEMYGHPLKIGFHINIQVSSPQFCMRTITQSCCLALLDFPKCPPAHPAACSAADRPVVGPASPLPPAAPQEPFKDLPAVTLEWALESSVCKPANASSFRCDSSDSTSSLLLPVLPPASWPHSPRSMWFLKGCIQKSEQCSLQGLAGADLGRGVEDRSL